jgi:hypothetical protein
VTYLLIWDEIPEGCRVFRLEFEVGSPEAKKLEACHDQYYGPNRRITSELEWLMGQIWDEYGEYGPFHKSELTVDGPFIFDGPVVLVRSGQIL